MSADRISHWAMAQTGRRVSTLFIRVGSAALRTAAFFAEGSLKRVLLSYVRLLQRLLL
jgi:hypothetical protein